MSKINPKQLASTIPGIGAKVVNRDINSAIRTWKMKLKNSEKMEELQERKQFIKPSITRRQEIKTAKYKQSFVTERNK